MDHTAQNPSGRPFAILRLNQEIRYKEISQDADCNIQGSLGRAEFWPFWLVETISWYLLDRCPNQLSRPEFLQSIARSDAWVITFVFGSSLP